MIRVYPSTLPGQPVETHEAHGSLDDFLREKCGGYVLGDDQPFVCSVDGVAVPGSQWDRVDCASDVRLYHKAQGGDALGWLSVIFPLTFAPFGAATLLSPTMPDVGGQGQRGTEIKTSDIRANTARHGQVIPEGVGRYIRYPDYLLPRHSYFENEKYQYSLFLLCVGKGRYQIEDLKIGDTLAAELGEDLEIEVFEPGADVSGNLASEYWHPAPEVGGTRTGSAGIELTGLDDPVTNSGVDEYSFADKAITASVGAFSATWGNVTKVRLVSLVSWEVDAGGGEDGRKIVTGDTTELDPYVGMPIEIAGANSGFYVIHSFTATTIQLDYPDATPVTDLPSGTFSMCIGPQGLQYEVSSVDAAAMVVDRLDHAGTVQAGWPGFNVLTSTEVTLTSLAYNTNGEFFGPFAACPAGEKTAKIEWDIFFPGGLVALDDDGDRNWRSVNIELQYRKIGETSYTSIVKTYISNVLDQIGYTESLDLPSADRWEVRARRVGAISNSPQVQEKAQWYGLRSKLTAPTKYDEVTTMAVKLRGGNRISGQSDQMINCIATRLLPTLTDSGWGTEAPTRNIADIAAHIAKDIGHTDEQIDLEELRRLNAIWQERGDTFDYFFDETTVKEAINTTLRAGFAELTIDRGKIRPVRDEARTTFEHIYTPQGMTETLTRSFDSPRPDEHDGVEVEYTDADTWAKSTVLCLLPGDSGFKLDRVKLDGVLSRTQAWRIGMRKRRAQAYRRWQMEFSTELDALNSKYMGYVGLADDVPGYGQSSLLMTAEPHAQGAKLTTTEPADWLTPGSYYVAIRNQDGTAEGPFEAQRGATDYDVIAVGASVPTIQPHMEPPHVLFGPADTWVFPALISKISPQGFESVTVNAVNYDERIYADDNNTPEA